MVKEVAAFFVFSQLHSIGTLAWYKPPWVVRWMHSPLEELSCQTPERLVAESDADSGLRVIVPSIGQTGTSSLLAALNKIGYRGYHFEETVHFLRPILPVSALGNAALFARTLSRCRVDVLSLEPLLDQFETVLRASPRAKVVMGVRDFSSWHLAAMYGGGKDLVFAFVMGTVTGGFRLLPWLDAIDLATGAVSNLFRSGRPFTFIDGQISDILQYLLFWSHAKFAVGGDAVEHNTRWASPKIWHNGTEAAYQEVVDNVIRLTPPDRLLMFDVKKHGWAELTTFLGHENIPGGPFPHPRSKASWTNDPSWDRSPWYMRIIILAICFVTHVIPYMLIRWLLLRALRQCSTFTRLRCAAAPTANKRKAE